MRLSIIIPAYNEGNRIGNTLKKYLSYRFSYPTEIIVVLNGCADNTLDVVRKFGKKLRYYILDEASKGKAIIKGIKEAKGDLVCYVDADYSTKANELDRLVSKIDGYDAVIASRWVSGAKIRIKQPLLRRIASRGFNLLVRIVLGLKFKDTQAGVKIFRKDALDSIMKDLTPTNWAFDVSILYPLVKKGFKVREVATEWEDKRGSKLKLYKAIPNMFWAVIKIRFKK